MTTPEIDRIAPTRQPSAWPVMRQQWRDLLFLHWPVAPEELRPLIPPQLALDLFEGTAYVGLVPFTMRGVRPVGVPPVPGLSNFHETNVRTYVHYRGSNPGVWFFSLDAANPIAVTVARRLFYLPYYWARMSLEREAPPRADERETIVYAGDRRRPQPSPASYLVKACPTGMVRPAVPGTLEHFLAERYILYSRSHHHLYRGRVHHRPYPLQTADVLALEESVLGAAAIRRPAIQPLAHFASGVDVKVYALDKVE